MKSGLQSVSWEIEFLETELRSCVKSISQGTIVGDLLENQNKKYSEKDGNRRKAKRSPTHLSRINQPAHQTL